MIKEDVMARGRKKEVTEVVEPVIEELTPEKAVEILEEAIVEEKPAVKTGIVKGCGLLNVRDRASLEGQAVKQLSANARINILGEENNFYKIDGGFVMKDFVEIM